MKEESKGNNFPLNPYRSDPEQGGTQRTLLDIAGQLFYAWDAEDRKTEIIYDELRRPMKRITNDKELERYIYGEGLANDKIKNLRGQLYQHYDGSGLQQINIYDFKGNALETQQQLLENPTLSDSNWDSSPALSTEVFAKLITYDALNRPITQTDPGGNVQAFTYDKGGLLETVKLNNENYVNDIHYDAKGQRQAIWYGNGTKTSYTYDAFTFRLRRLLTVNLNDNKILQDLNYWYDPVGNITEIQDDAQQTLFFNNSIVAPTQKFTYDAIYRLIEAKGRELIGTNFGSEDNWNDAAWKTNHKGDGSAVQNYIQKYTYDEVGNVLELQHIAGTGSYTRTYNYDVDSNKLLSTSVGSITYSYDYDARGNMMAMPHLSAMNWNTQNELKSIMKGSEPTYYQYSNGERIRKHTVKGNIKEERIYLGNFEIYRKFEGGSLKIERQTVHINDDTGRIAMLEKRTFGSAADDNDTAESLERFVYNNHLQSASLELDETGAIISYEEYHPYGTTSYQANNANIKAVAKRYRYTGKERDEESGLYYHGARYYVPWLGRWTAVDPLAIKQPTKTPFHYVNNNPINRIDPDGKDDYEINAKGEIVNRIKNKEADSFFMINEEGKRIETKSISFKYGTIESVRSQKGQYSKRNEETGDIEQADTNIDIYKVRGDENAKTLFEFFAENTYVEWSHIKTGEEGAKGLSFLTTGHIEYTEPGVSALIIGQLYAGYTIRQLNHSHPKNTPVPSGIPNLTDMSGGGDVKFAEIITNWYKEQYPDRNTVPEFNIYIPKSKEYIPYNKDSQKSDFGY